MVVTYILIIVPSVLFIRNVATKWGAWCIVVTTFLLLFTLRSYDAITFKRAFLIRLLCFSMYSLTACSDPGIVFKAVDSDEEEVPAGRDLTSAEEGRTPDFQGESAVASRNNSSSKRAKTAVGDRDLDRDGSSGGSRALGQGFLGRDRDLLLECGVCGIRRPANASHCYECGVCVVELDHHCPVCRIFPCLLL